MDSRRILNRRRRKNIADFRECLVRILAENESLPLFRLEFPVGDNEYYACLAGIHLAAVFDVAQKGRFGGSGKFQGVDACDFSVRIALDNAIYHFREFGYFI